MESIITGTGSTSYTLNESRRKEIRKVFGDRYSLLNNTDLTSFTSRYVDCEATARKLVGYYKSDRGIPVTRSIRSLKIIDIIRASEHFNLGLSEVEIKLIFETEGNRGNKSPRQLKASLMANKATNDLDEIIWRNKELSSYMDKWINAIKSTIKLNS